MKNKDTFTLWGLRCEKTKTVSDTFLTREGARAWRDENEQVVKLECRIVEPVSKKPKKPKTFTAHGLEWIPHTPGDPMPCDGETKVRFLFRTEAEGGTYVPAIWRAEECNWMERPNLSFTEIIGWNYAP